MVAALRQMDRDYLRKAGWRYQVMRRSFWHTLVGVGFRLLYNELAWTYDTVSWLVSLGSWRLWQQSTLPYILGDRLLEVGHGPGHMLAALHQAGYRVCGLDLSPQMGRLAQKKVPVPLVLGSAQQLPFVNASFDTVLSTFPTEYILDPETLRAIHRVLRPNGRLIVVPEGHLTGTSPLHRFITWLFEITGQRRPPWNLEEGQEDSAVDPWQLLRQLFGAGGFTIEFEHVQLPRSSVTILIATRA